MTDADPRRGAQSRLKARDLKVLLLWVLIGVLGAAVAFKYFFVAFPEASIDFRVSRAEAVEVARSFLTAEGFKLQDYTSSIVFRVDDDAKTYLEREVGLEQANRLMASEVTVWYWDVRFFRPRQQEEFRVRVNPAGRPVGFMHVIEEAREGAQLSREAARAMAENFLRRSAADLAAYEFLPEEANSTERPKRRDWRFTWERRGFKAPAREGGAPYRLRVSLQGAEVGGSEEFLKVPEAWLRDFQRLRSSNTLYGTIALVPYALLYGALLWVLFDLGRRGRICWRGALKLGLILAVLFFVMQANQWPLERANYDTNSSYSGYFLNRMVQAALGSLLLGLIVSLTLAGAEPLYREDQPEQVQLGAAFTLPGIRSKEFFRSCVIGLGMAAGHIGFVVLFYLVGKNFGFWAPQDINYTDVVSTALPWVYPLTIGIYASTSEEFLFRLFAIPFLLRMTGSRILAVVLPAFIWGFLHSAYPQEPGYVRGIEVGLIGIVAGVVMLRWGILATLVWHYTVDALLISLFLLRSGSLYFRVSGALVAAGVLIPLAVSAAFYLVRRRFEPEEALLNRAAPVVEAAAPAEPAAAPEREAAGYEALGSRTLGLVVLLGALGALLAATKAETIGSFVRVAVDARQAAAKASEVLRQRGLDPRTWRHTVTFEQTFDRYVNEFLRRQVGIAGANRIYQEKVPSAFWRVRYFRDSQKEEYAVVIGSDGSLHAIRHLLDEKAPGATLTKEEAQARAEAYLREEKGLDLARWKTVESTSEKRPARTDHAFTWEEIEPVGHLPGQGAAHVRCEVEVQGDEVFGYRVFIKIPEEWRRRQGEETLPLIIHRVGRILLFAGLGVTVLIIFLKNLKHPAVAGIPWRRLSKWALWGLLATLIAFGNTLPRLLSAYDTQIPFKTFTGLMLIGLLLVAGVIYSALLFVFGLAWFFLSRVFGAPRLPAWRGMPARYYCDAFWLALGGTGILVGLGRLPNVLERIWSPARRAMEASLPTDLDSYYPVAEVIAGAVTSGLFVCGLVGLAAGFLAGYLPKKWQQLAFILLVAVAQASTWGSPGDLARKVLVQFILLAVVWWGAVRLVRFNLLAYFLLVGLPAVSGAAVHLLRQPNPFFRANGYMAVAAALVLLAWPLAAWLRSAGASQTQPPGLPER